MSYGLLWALMFIAFILLVGREKAAESLSYLPWLALAAFICFVAFAILRAIWDEIIVPIWEEDHSSHPARDLMGDLGHLPTYRVVFGLVLGFSFVGP